MHDIYWFVVIGLAAGVLAGIFGIGGGIIIVPILVLVMGFTQTQATGTSLVALLAPVGVLGVVSYYRAGIIQAEQIKFGLMISLGMFFGTLIGSRIALGIPDVYLKRAFCIFLILVAVRLWLQTPKPSV